MPSQPRDPIGPRERVVAAVAATYTARERTIAGDLVEVARSATRGQTVLLDPVAEMILDEQGALAAPGATPAEVEAEVEAKIDEYRRQRSQLHRDW
jgi:hypothetical protein